MNYTTYMLELEGGKYYVGKTDNLPRRLIQHFETRDTSLTKGLEATRLVATYEGDVVDEICNHGINKYGVAHTLPTLRPQDLPKDNLGILN